MDGCPLEKAGGQLEMRRCVRQSAFTIAKAMVFTDIERCTETSLKTRVCRVVLRLCVVSCRWKGYDPKLSCKHRYPSKSERPGSRPDNVLARTFQASAPDRKWVADITYLWTNEGWLYLAIVLDLFSRRVVGWSMSDRADAQLACQALRAAVQRRKPNAGLLHHSDQGCQYTSEAFRDGPRPKWTRMQHEPSRKLLGQRRR